MDALPAQAFRPGWPDGYIIFHSLAVYIIEHLPISIKIA